MVEGSLHCGAVLDFQKCADVRVADTHVSASICDIPEVANRVLERLFFELGSAWFGVEGLDLGFELVLDRLDLLACLFVLRPVGCLVITAAVEDYVAANATRQAGLVRFCRRNIEGSRAFPLRSRFPGVGHPALRR
jgi:hypothetical protein